MVKLLTIFISAIIIVNANAAITSYTTANGQLRITNNTADEGLYYDCDPNEIAQNVQILKADANTFHAIYQSEPKKTVGSAYPGDSIKSGTQTGSFTYAMPTNKDFRIFGHPTDTALMPYLEGSPIKVDSSATPTGCTCY